MRGPRRILAALIPFALAACSKGGASTGTSPSASVLPPPRPASAAPAAPAAPARGGATAAADPNPLRLPPSTVTVEAGRRVFAVPEQMLSGARLGATLVLHAATVTGMDGEDLVVEGRGGSSYKLHPGYAIVVPDEPRLRPGDPVITEHGGVMKHAVVTRFVRDRVGVRYTDLDGRTQEILLPGGSGKPTAAGPSKAARFLRQEDGLRPGNYAALRQGDEYLHVLLVSHFGDGDARRFLALGFGGAAMIVSAPDLTPIPVKFAAKVGKVVWAESRGKLRRGTVQVADEQGLFTVKFERAGRPSVVGWGMLTAPLGE